MELGEYLSLSVEELLAAVPTAPMHCVKYIAMWYPNAYVRRECLKRQGVVFADDSSFANMGFCVIPNAPGKAHVYIGRNVSIAPNVTCICSASANSGKEINTFLYVTDHLTCDKNITLHDDCWIGANATLLPGVEIGRCCVVGAGAVVTANTDDYGIYAGVPARKIGDVRAWEDGDGE